MCGITAIFNIHSNAADLRQQALKMSKRIRHRGPDWSGIYQGKTAILAHERLSIVDPASGGQPLRSKDGQLILTVNGEIYNHRELREQLKDEYEFQTGSDCEVILALYRKYGVGCVEKLSGIFGFALYDETDSKASPPHTDSSLRDTISIAVIRISPAGISATGCNMIT